MLDAERQRAWEVREGLQRAVSEAEELRKREKQLEKALESANQEKEKGSFRSPSSLVTMISGGRLNTTSGNTATGSQKLSHSEKLRSIPESGDRKEDIRNQQAIITQGATGSGGIGRGREVGDGAVVENDMKSAPLPVVESTACIIS
jgi:hypothetical protein